MLDSARPVASQCSRGTLSSFNGQSRSTIKRSAVGFAKFQLGVLMLGMLDISRGYQSARVV